MFERGRRLFHLRDGRDLLVLFALTVLTPGILLVAVGVRAFVQERRFTTQQIRERVDRAADLAARDLELEMRDWHSALTRVASGAPVDATAFPSTLRAAFDEPGAGLAVVAGAHGRLVWPERQLLYRPVALAAAPEGAAVPPAVAEAESIEMREHDYARAAAAYERLLAHAAAPDRLALLNRLARTYRKAGREADARRIFETLSSSTGMIGTLPAALIGQYELRSRDLYANLVGGRWLLDRPRYLFYTTAARSWIPDEADGGAINRLSDLEARKRKLTEAVDSALEGQPSTEYVLWPAAKSLETGGSPGAAVLISRAWLASHLWPTTFARTVRDGFDVSVIGESGDALFQSSPPAERRSGSPLAATRSAGEAPDGWRVRVSPRDPRVLAADLERRQTVFLVMLVLLTASLGFGSYLTTRAMRKELEIARLKSEFVATVSHEFRTPLTGIRQLGELLSRGRVPTEARRQEYYERITRESERLGRLVENLLDFARMEAGRKQYRFERIDLFAWLRHLVTEIEPHCTSRGMSIRPDIPDALPPVMVDREALGCAVENLIDNAVKYSPGRQALWLQAEAVNGHVTIRVRDEGVGIGDADRRRIFEKFYRGRAEIARDVKGAGLGLSLVRHIVDAHGGRVECQSRLGEGSTFSIHLRSGDRRL